MKKIKYIIIVILFTLTGCLNYVELNDIGIINVIGIDKDNDGYVININMVTPTGDDLEKSTTYEVFASTLEEAFDRLYLLKSSLLSFIGFVSRSFKSLFPIAVEVLFINLIKLRLWVVSIIFNCSRALFPIYM